MKADKLTLEKIFDHTERLEAPLFQRPYVWKKNENWIPLWDAIEGIAQKRLENKFCRPHFLGAIVLDQLKTSTGKVHARQIIDGQQRLTTLQLVLGAIRDFCSKAQQSRYAEAIKKLTDNYVPLSDDDDDKLKVLPTNADREDFKQVMRAGSEEAVFSMPHSNPDDEFLIPNAYLYFSGKLREWLHDGGENFLNRLECMYTALREDLHLVVIDLEEADDAQEIFETLNALGTPLLPADLIKNFLFRQAELQDKDSKNLYEKYWQSFDGLKSYWRQQIRQGRLKRARLDHYLGHYLVMMTGEEAIATQLFTGFKDLFEKSDERDAAKHMELFKRYADVYQSFDNYKEDTREGLFFSRLYQLDNTTIYPLLLEVFRIHANNESRHELLQILTDLESYLIRRAVCELTSKNYNRLFASLIKSLREEKTFSSGAIRQWLLNQKAETSLWPNDDTFKEAWMKLRFYRRLSKATTRLILEAINSEMQTSKTEEIITKHNLTIEHLLPVEWKRHWPLPVGENDTVLWNQAADQRNDLLHRIGNLTLLTKALNPSVSNGPWLKKKEQILKHSALNLNRAFQNDIEWNEEKIEKRSEELFGYAVKIWPYPTEVIESPI
jgi:uncharacterized protein with ParB-like and HNH nuclease domain